MVRIRGGWRAVALVVFFVACGDSDNGSQQSAAAQSSEPVTTERHAVAETTDGVGPTVVTAPASSGEVQVGEFASCAAGEEPAWSSFDEVTGSEIWTTC